MGRKIDANYSDPYLASFFILHSVLLIIKMLLSYAVHIYMNHAQQRWALAHFLATNQIGSAIYSAIVNNLANIQTVRY